MTGDLAIFGGNPLVWRLLSYWKWTQRSWPRSEDTDCLLLYKRLAFHYEDAEAHEGLRSFPCSPLNTERSRMDRGSRKRSASLKRSSSTLRSLLHELELTIC